MKVCFCGPLLDMSGYAHFSRNFLKMLQHGGLDVVARALKYDRLDPGQMFEPSQDLTTALSRPLEGIDVLIQSTTPNVEAQPKPGILNGIFFFWETDRFSPEVINKLNSFDFIMVGSSFNAQSLAQCGCSKPILVSMPPCDADVYKLEYSEYPLHNVQGRTIFYNICQFSTKKGIDALIRSYYAAFADRPDEVALVLKTYISMANRIREIDYIKSFIEHIRAGCRIPIKKYPPIIPLMQTMSEDEIHGLHRGCDAYVNSSRGEGWNYPAFDACAHGTTLISNQGTAMADWVRTDNAIVYGGSPGLCYEVNHGDPTMYIGVDRWFEPSTAELADAMRTFHLLRKGQEDGTLSPEGEQMWAKILTMRSNGQRLGEQLDYRRISKPVCDQLRAAYDSWKTNGKVEFNANAAQAVKREVIA